MRADNDDDLVQMVQDHATSEHNTDLTGDHILASAREV
jgi:predicted small metal-binding protein